MAVVLLAAGFAWLTRHPDAEILERAQEWPLIGHLAREFRLAYMPPKQAPVEDSSPGDSGAEVVFIYVPPEESLATSFVWVQPGTELHEKPDLQSPVLDAVASIRNLPVLEQSGDWYRVSSPISKFDRLQGWVWLADYEEPTPEVLRAPDPVLPLPARSADPEKVEVARRLMGESAELSCVLYPLVTDATDSDLLQLCPRVTRKVEELYRRRYGLEPVSPPAETILLFRREESYHEFRILQEVGFESAAHASPAFGYVALYRGDRAAEEILATLVHELTHLLNRRALGPALPPWLGEGIAADLGELMITEEGSIHPAPMYLQGMLKNDELPTLAMLIDMDQEQFHERPRTSMHYVLSSLWIRYLLSDFKNGLQTGFRSFLRGTAQGRPITSHRLLEELGTDWQSLESGFRTWLRLQYLTPTSVAGADSA